jgi:hypothetical protein
MHPLTHQSVDPIYAITVFQPITKGCNCWVEKPTYGSIIGVFNFVFSIFEDLEPKAGYNILVSISLVGFFDDSEDPRIHVGKELMLTTEVILISLSHALKIVQNLLESFVVCFIQFPNSERELRVLSSASV